MDSHRFNVRFLRSRSLTDMDFPFFSTDIHIYRNKSRVTFLISLYLGTRATRSSNRLYLSPRKKCATFNYIRYTHMAFRDLCKNRFSFTLKFASRFQRNCLVPMIHDNVCKFLHSWSNIQSVVFAVSKWDESQCAKKSSCLRIATIIASHFPRRCYLNTKPNKPFATFPSFSLIYLVEINEMLAR